MNLNNKTTDELLEIIVTRIGIPLPKFDHDYKKFTAEYPKNEQMGEGVTFMPKSDMFDTFKEACISIVQWAIDNEDIALKL